MKIPNETETHRLNEFIKDLEKLLNKHHVLIVPTCDTQEQLSLCTYLLDPGQNVRVEQDCTGDPTDIVIREE